MVNSAVHDLTLKAVKEFLEAWNFRIFDTNKRRPDAIAVWHDKVIAIDIKTGRLEGEKMKRDFPEYDYVMVIKAKDLDDILNGTFTIDAKELRQLGLSSLDP